MFSASELRDIVNILLTSFLGLYSKVRNLFFSTRFMARALRALVINPCGKNLVHNLKCGPRARLVRSITSNNRFHITARLFSNILMVTSKCGKNEKVAHQASPSVSLMSSPYFDIICHGLLTHGNVESI